MIELCSKFGYNGSLITLNRAISTMSRENSAPTSPDKKLQEATQWVNNNPYLALAKDKGFQDIIRSIPTGSGISCFGRYKPSNALFKELINQLNRYHKESYSENGFYAQLFETAKDDGLMKEGFRGGRSLLTLISVFFCVSALIITPVTVNYLMPFLESVLSAGAAHAFTAVACVLGVALAVSLAFAALEAFFTARHTPMLVNALWSKKDDIDKLFDEEYRPPGDHYGDLLGISREYDAESKKAFIQTISLGRNYHTKIDNDLHASKKDKKSGYISLGDVASNHQSQPFKHTPLKPPSRTL